MYDDYDYGYDNHNDNEELHDYINSQNHFHNEEDQEEEGQAQLRVSRNEGAERSARNDTRYDVLLAMVSSTGLTGIHSDSEYKNGKGIHYVVNFCAQLPPLEANEKRRLNARAPVINGSFYAHELLSLAEVLDGAIGILGRND
ncbi:hypothetical protein B0H14DRAFT_2557696 [Mycena olivaceomarginata]|nr:hypothetical protein B0H14DRAFT_2557696 [Mycena olivaceomarginata]